MKFLNTVNLFTWVVAGLVLSAMPKSAFAVCYAKMNGESCYYNMGGNCADFEFKDNVVYFDGTDVGEYSCIARVVPPRLLPIRLPRFPRFVTRPPLIIPRHRANLIQPLAHICATDEFGRKLFVGGHLRQCE